MQFVKDGEIYKVARITGVQDNLLGITLADAPTKIDLVALPASDARKAKTNPDEVLRQVAEGLSEVNLELGSNYHVSKIFYLPHESAANSVYKLLIVELIRRIDAGEIALQIMG